MQIVALRPDRGKQIPHARSYDGPGNIGPILPCNHISSDRHVLREIQRLFNASAGGKGCTGKLSTRSPTKRLTRLPASTREVCTPFPHVPGKKAENRQ